jgi:RHS repeat-associated protein
MVMHVASGAQSGAAPGDYTVTYHRYVTGPGGGIVNDYGTGVFGVGVHANDATVYTGGNELWASGSLTKVYQAIQTAAGGQAVIEYLSVAPSNDGYGGDPSVQLVGQKKWTITRSEPCGGCGGTTTVDQLMPVTLFGGGTPSGQPPDANQTKGRDANTGCPNEPMASYSIHLMLASLHIEDTPISYNSPRGPATDFKVIYNQREANQPTTFPFCNLGPKWTSNWLSYVTDDPANPSANAAVYVRGGGTETYSGFNSGTQSYAPDMQSVAVLVRTSGITYEKRFPDGSKEVFAFNDGSTSYPRRIFLTGVVDAAGNTTTVTYDSSLRITTITDSLGQATTITYGLTGDPLKITKVTDPFGRFATFDYTSGQLTRITDPVGIQSQFAYLSGTDFINALTTPYGTTTFAKGESGNSLRWLEATDPLGAKERVEYNDSASGIASNESVAPPGVYNNGLQVQNTFYWNKEAMADAPGDYTKAQVFHWLSTPDGKVSGIKHSEKQPLENRVWYTYAGQTDAGKVGTNALPITVSRVLDDGTTQQSQYQYNSLGNLTKGTDPAGRVFSYVYASNGIDLLERHQTRGTNNELIASFTYNGQHLALTSTDAARETTTYTYNSYGQLRTVTNAKNETTTYTYDRDQDHDGVTDGYLISVTGPVTGAITTFTYDMAQRVQSVTDSDAYTVTTTYDNIDRPLTLTYPDTTTRQFAYTDNVTGVMTLDLTGSKDRRGRWTYRHYNANRQLDKITDPLSRNTLFNWCTCGALGSITDGNNHVTSFTRDVQGRVTSKVFADTKSVAYTYENATSRLKSLSDAKSQVTNYQYYIDNDLKQISYTNTAGQALTPPTPTVTFSYDPNYNRVVTMVDGTGTTTYAYNAITGSVSLGAGQLQSVAGPLPNSTITYSYDELGRALSSAVNGISASQTYDNLGRVTTITNPLGQFTNSYYSVSNRLQSIAYPNGQGVNYVYFTNLGDKRLQTILNNGPSASLVSKFDYQYDGDGEITKWTRQFGTSDGIQWDNSSNSMGDLADQLTTVIERDAVTQALRTSYSYGYDSAGNRTSDNSGSYSLSNVNQITNTAYTYDNNGNLTGDPSRTYEWDAANRLVAINYTAIGGRTEFTYDGLGRRVKTVEKNPGMSMIVQPPNTNYTTYTSSSFPLTAGTYVLTLQGLNSNGGDNTAFVDALTLNGTLVPNGGFETPALSSGSFAYAPSGGTWLFVGYAGISSNGSGFTSGNPNAPEGNQVGIVQMGGSMSQSLSLATGSYTLTIKAAQRGNGNSSYQQVQVSVQAGNPIASTKQFVWNGNRIAEERDANNNVTRRFYPQGEQISGASYYYTRDHLGSVRELTDSTGAVRARYDYDPYGMLTKISGDLDADFGFTGHWHHGPSGLDLSLYRAYSSTLGRWLSRDPIGEQAGANLYVYVGNNSTNAIDPFGLDTIVLFASEAVLGQGHIATLIGTNSTGWTYYSRNGYGNWPWYGDATIRTYATYEDFKNDTEQSARYDQAYHIRTTPDADLAMKEYADEQIGERYHSIVPPSNNCADLTEETLEAGGYRVPGNNQYPLFLNLDYIGSPEVPKFLFQNIVHTKTGRLWNVFP